MSASCREVSYARRGAGAAQSPSRGDTGTVQVVAVGVSHNTAPVGLRERLALSADAVPAALCRLAQSVEEAFILSTCSRIEVYAMCGHESTGAELLRQFLSTQSGVEPHIIGDVSYAC